MQRKKPLKSILQKSFVPGLHILNDFTILVSDPYASRGFEMLIVYQNLFVLCGVRDRTKE
jgi:hypothetical protein